MTGPTLYERWNVSISEELPRPVVVKSRTRLPEPGWYGWRPGNGTQRFPTFAEAIAYATGGQR